MGNAVGGPGLAGYVSKSLKEMPMSFDLSTGLWSNGEEHFFRERLFKPIKQSGPHCVSTALAILTGKRPSHFLRMQKSGELNTQDPFSWSEALKPFGMKLAYVPFDVRKLRFYMDELVGLDDSFLLCYYTRRGSELLRDPDEQGWVCGSHVVILHRDEIIDPLLGNFYAFDHHCNECHTKRIFRVVPCDNPRGL
jgi:hypothetical protein